MAVGGAEEHFAKKLAHNDKKIRDRAVKRLQAWIASRKESGDGFSELDLLKIWKGLFYCFWMSDKPLVQEELAKNISQLLHSFRNTESAFIFITSFFKTMHREWHGIDRLRMDKFYMLIRMFVKETFVLVMKSKWNMSLCERLSTIYKDGPLSPTEEKVPDGMRLHLAGMFLQELKEVGNNEVPPDIVLLLLEPFFLLAAYTKSQVVASAVKSGIFENLIEAEEEKREQYESDEGNEKPTEEKHIEIDCQAVSDKLFKLASERQVLGRNRNMLYLYVKKFKIVVSENKEKQLNTEVAVEKKRKLQPESDVVEEGKDSEEDEQKRKKKRKTAHVCTGTALNEVNDSSSNQEISNEVMEEKKKRKTAHVCTGTALNEVNDSSSNQEISNEVMEEKKKRKGKKGRKSTDSSSSTLNGKHLPGEVEESTAKLEPVVKKKRKGKKDTGDQNIDMTVGKEKSKMKVKQKKEAIQNELVDPIENTEVLVMKQIVKTKLKNGRNNINLSTEKCYAAVSEAVSDASEVDVEDVLSDLRQKITKTQQEKGSAKKAKGSVTPKTKLSNGVSFATFEKMKSTPPAYVKKRVPHTEPRKIKKVEGTPLCPDSAPQGSKKKVRIALSKNTAHTTQDYAKSLQESPTIPFNAERSPGYGLLKSKPVHTPTTIKTSMKTLMKRTRAADFF